MSVKYDEYILEHKYNVTRAYDWLVANLPEIFPDEKIKSDVEWQCKNIHDKSKYEQSEYKAYDEYFYGNRTAEVVSNFNLAWLHHIHKNPHHWQYWVLIEDNSELQCLEIPLNYIIEMICDWWSFSWKKDNLYELFDWYDHHKDSMKINDASRKNIEHILELIHKKLDAIC
jgi:hypothetical protein